MTKTVIPTAEYSAALGALRGLAASVVVVFHTLLVLRVGTLDDPHRQALVPSWSWEFVTLVLVSVFNGHAAVIMFFVLSGLVLALSLDQRGSSSLSTFAGYYVRRAARLAPALLVATAFATLLCYTWFTPETAPAFTTWANGYYRHIPDAKEIFTNAIGLNASLNPPAWTIYVEIAASVLFPIIFLATSTTWLSVLSVSATLVLTLCVPNWAGFGQYMLSFVMGAVLYRYRSEIAEVYRSTPRLFQYIAIGMALGILTFFDRFYAPHVHMHPHVVLAMTLASCVVVAIVYLDPPEVLRSSRSLQKLGEWSYSLYLLHFPILFAIAQILAPALTPPIYQPSPAAVLGIAVALSLVVLAITIAASALVYAGIEKPGIAMGRRFGAMVEAAVEFVVSKLRSPFAGGRAATGGNAVPGGGLTNVEATAQSDQTEILAHADKQGLGYEAVSDQIALSAAHEHQGPLIIDFDETLYLRNSTEDFLDCARPAPVAGVLLRTLDIIKPWRLLGGDASRDQYRILLITLILPWTWLLWRGRARRLGQQYLNRPLADRIAPKSTVVIASIGFESIIRPLLASMQLTHRPLVACRLLNARDRRQGKLALLDHKIGRALIGTALSISDSATDEPLFSASQRGLLVAWPDAAFHGALSDIYLPFRYASAVKRPGQRYVWRGIIQDDFAFWLLAAVPVASQPLWLLAGAPFLLVSFWAVYETGYVDNDRIGHRLERDPRLSEAFFANPVQTPLVQPWIWSGAFGLIGLSLLAGGTWPSLESVVAWAAVLVLASATFYLFNRIVKPLRLLLYPVLQAFRMGAIAAVATIAPITVGVLLAATVSAWIGYVAYRQRRDNTWPALPLATFRLVATIVFTAFLLLTLGVTHFNLGLAALVVAWTAFRARGELVAIVKSNIWLPSAKSAK